MIEITGCPGAGKSTVYDSAVKISVLKISGLWPIAFFRLLIFHNEVFFYLVASALKLKRNCRSRLAFFYHSVRKFSLFFAFRDVDCVIDEGLIHIAFNLELDTEEQVLKFLNLFERFLKTSHVVIVTANCATLVDRLSTRGHKRLRRFEHMYEFVAKNKKVEELLFKHAAVYVRSLRIVNNEV